MTTSTPSHLLLALSIAGLDPSGGAGVIANVRTFAAFGVFPTAAVTSVTFQNTTGVFGAAHQSAETVRAQVLPIVEDYTVACAKTGMLPTREVIVEVARLFRETNLPAPVVDPVIRSTSGYQLMDEGALESLVKDLLPLARVVTPNIPEAEGITGLHINDEEEMRHAAQAIREMGARAVLIKGGHLREQEAVGRRQKAENMGRGTSRPHSSSTDADEKAALPAEAIDLLDDDGRVKVFRGEWIHAGQIHGTGCTLSAAIAACLGGGMSLEESVLEAKRFVADAICRAARLGHGARPLV